MIDQNWDHLGEEMKNRVDQAIRCGDFTNLSRSIGDMVNETIDSVKGSLYRGHAPDTEGYSSDGRTRQNSGGFCSSGTTTDAQSQYRGTVSRENSKQPPALYQTVPKGKVSGILMCVGGFAGVVIFGIVLMVFFFLHLFGGFPFALMIVMAALTLGSLVIAVKGTSMLGLANRFQRYVRLCSQQMYVPLSMLAEKTGRTVGYITKDLKKMIARGMFFQAHIDEEEPCLILSDQAYRQYIEAKQTYQEQKRAAEEDARTRAELSPECRRLIADGEAYIKHIHSCNEALPGVEISAKLDQMERVVSRIFSVVQVHPEVAPELRKLMSYYLPTTKKLLDAYVEMDRQPVAGENISTTKREIENTIDTLNVAFEKLLDDLFVDKAWDISSDISVLNTVLAQDGLKEDGLRKKKNM